MVDTSVGAGGAPSASTGQDGPFPVHPPCPVSTPRPGGCPGRGFCSWSRQLAPSSGLSFDLRGPTGRVCSLLPPQLQRLRDTQGQQSAHPQTDPHLSSMSSPLRSAPLPRTGLWRPGHSLSLAGPPARSPALPAVCQVVPEVRRSRSSSTAPLTPSLARWYRVWQPRLPPPMTTTLAVLGRGRLGPWAAAEGPWASFRVRWYGTLFSVVGPAPLVRERGPRP